MMGPPIRDLRISVEVRGRAAILWELETEGLEISPRVLSTEGIPFVGDRSGVLKDLENGELLTIWG